MYNCEKVLGLINEYIDNELPNDEIKNIEEHLATCSECREEYDLSIRLKREMQILNEVSLPSGFNESLHEKLMSENKKSYNNIIKMVTSIAAVILLFVFGVQYLNLNDIKMNDFKTQYPNNIPNKKIASAPRIANETKDETVKEMQTFGIAEDQNVAKKGVANVEQRAFMAPNEDMQSRVAGFAAEPNQDLKGKAKVAQKAIPENKFKGAEDATAGAPINKGYMDNRKVNYYVVIVPILVLVALIYIINRFRKK